MEQTLGKRIVTHRKRLGLTQDRLAELLGVTAQAVSKWENDQSCPDITMLPKLAEIFGITTDALLGVARQEPIHTAELLTEEPERDEDEPEGIHVDNDGWEFTWENSRRGTVWMAVWVLLAGALLLFCSLNGLTVQLWTILWTTALLLLGLSGLLRRRPHVTGFHLCCGFLGGYFLLTEVLGQELNRQYILPCFLLLFGISLLAKAMTQPKTSEFHIHRNGKNLKKHASQCSQEEESFSCETCFGEDRHCIQLPRLSSGKAEVCFGALTVDLRGCGEFAASCQVALDCSFGELVLILPRSCRAVTDTSTAFGNVTVQGAPAADAADILMLSCNASFGQIRICYI